MSSKADPPPESWTRHPVLRVLCRPLTGPYELVAVSSLTPEEFRERATRMSKAGKFLVTSSKLNVYNTSAGYAVERSILPYLKLGLSPLLYLSAIPPVDPVDRLTVRMSWLMPRFYVGFLAFILLSIALALVGLSLEGSEFSRDFSTEIDLSSALVAMGVRGIWAVITLSAFVRIIPLKWTLDLTTQTFQLDSMRTISE